MIIEINSSNIDKMVPCEVCNKPVEATLEALNAWDDLVHYDCLCTACYWRGYSNG